MLRAFFACHRAASTWTRTILYEAAAALDLNVLIIDMPEQWAAYPSLGDMVRDQKPDILSMTNPRPEQLESLPELRGFHIIRDPRDLVVSGYFSHRNSHPEVVRGNTWHDLLKHRERLRTLDREEGLLAEIEFCERWFEPLLAWNYDDPQILELRMEDVIVDPVTAWTTIFTHLEMLAPAGSMAPVIWNLAARRGTPTSLALLRRMLPRLPLRRLPPGYVQSALDRFTFTYLSKSSRQPGQEDENSHYRKGLPGDWRNHLSEVHLEAIRARYGDLVTRLGYEE